MRDSARLPAESQDNSCDYEALSCGLPIDDDDDAKVAEKTEEDDFISGATETKIGGKLSTVLSVKVPRPLGRMYSDGEDTTYSAESRKTHSIRVVGLSLSFEDSKLESDYKNQANNGPRKKDRK